MPDDNAAAADNTAADSSFEIIRIADPADERLGDYTNLTDVVLRSKHEPAKGMYIAESTTVIRRALAAGHRPLSFLMAEKWLPDLTPLIQSLGVGEDGEPLRVFVGEPEVLKAITGFNLHRGALAAMRRALLPTVSELLAGAGAGVSDGPRPDATGGQLSPLRRVAVFEDIVDHTNLGAAFRSAAALGVDAVLLTPACADPLYRRSIRVSMGTVFQVPWARFEEWPQGIETLREAGFVTAALALEDYSISLDDLVADVPERLALVFGTEGDGLRRHTISAADVVVRIPMAGGVDSLNVAAAAAVAFWATRPVGEGPVSSPRP